MARAAEALADIEKWRRIDNTPFTWAAETYVYGRSGRQEEARRTLAKMEAVVGRKKLDPTAMYVVAYAGMKAKDKAFSWLNKGLLTHSSAVMAVKLDPIYDPLRYDPRFQKLLQQVGLAQ
jgi:endo-alpha-1,4-polygalactosaminidase (GH114 family)